MIYKQYSRGDPTDPLILSITYIKTMTTMIQPPPNTVKHIASERKPVGTAVPQRPQAPSGPPVETPFRQSRGNVTRAYINTWAVNNVVCWRPKLVSATLRCYRREYYFYIR